MRWIWIDKFTEFEPGKRRVAASVAQRQGMATGGMLSPAQPQNAPGSRDRKGAESNMLMLGKGMTTTKSNLMDY